jgi:hypothetical protein
VQFGTCHWSAIWCHLQLSINWTGVREITLILKRWRKHYPPTELKSITSQKVFIWISIIHHSYAGCSNHNKHSLSQRRYSPNVRDRICLAQTQQSPWVAKVQCLFLKPTASYLGSYATCRFLKITKIKIPPTCLYKYKCVPDFWFSQQWPWRLSSFGA